MWARVSESVPEARPRKERQVNRETQQVKADMMEFLKRMRRSVAADFVKVVQELTDKLYANHDAPVDDLTDMVQDFYIKLAKRMDSHTIYKGTVYSRLNAPFPLINNPPPPNFSL